jgi:hypothetical protein
MSLFNKTRAPSRSWRAVVKKRSPSDGDPNGLLIDTFASPSGNAAPTWR